MLTRLQQTVEKHHMLRRDDHIVIGLSGGADSVCLLYGLLELRPLYCLQITAVHVHHGLRGADADADLIFVEELCDRLSIPLFVYRYDIQKIAGLQKISLEEAGRSMRYAAFQETADQCNASKIAVAHHMNDNAETVLMRLARGAGLKGLGGIAPVRGCIIRPLIDTTREEIESFLTQKAIPYITDATNQSDQFTRNKIRHRYLPMLELEVNPRIVQTLNRTAAILREEESYLQELADQIYRTMVTESPDGLHIDLAILNSYPDVMKSRLLRLACSRFNPDLHNISHTHVDMLLRLSNTRTGKTIQLPHALVVEREYDRLHFLSGESSAQGFCYAITDFSGTRRPDCRQAIDIWLWIPEINKHVSVSHEKILYQPTNLKCLCAKEVNCDKINGILQIRNRLPGDRIFIRNVGGKKIKDYFIDHKVPRYRRDRVALITDANQVIWILDEKNITNSLYQPISGANTIFIQLWEEQCDSYL